MAGSCELELGDLAGEAFVSLDEASMTRMKIDSAFEAANIPRRMEIQAEWSASIFGLVGRGLGVSIIEPFTASDYASHGVVVRPISPKIDFTFLELRRSNASKDSTINAFSDMFQMRFEKFDDASQWY